jgi:hypothetical protein
MKLFPANSFNDASNGRSSNAILTGHRFYRNTGWSRKFLSCIGQFLRCQFGTVGYTSSDQFDCSSRNAILPGKYSGAGARSGSLIARTNLGYLLDGKLSVSVLLSWLANAMNALVFLFVTERIPDSLASYHRMLTLFWRPGAKNIAFIGGSDLGSMLCRLGDAAHFGGTLFYGFWRHMALAMIRAIYHTGTHFLGINRFATAASAEKHGSTYGASVFDLVAVAAKSKAVGYIESIVGKICIRAQMVCMKETMALGVLIAAVLAFVDVTAKHGSLPYPVFGGKTREFSNAALPVVMVRAANLGSLFVSPMLGMLLEEDRSSLAFAGARAILLFLMRAGKILVTYWTMLGICHFNLLSILSLPVYSNEGGYAN